MRTGRTRCTLGWLAVLSVSATGAFSRPNPNPATRMNLLTLRSEVFHNTRTIRVWLPIGYRDSPSRRYPVFYFTDGIATFHGRELDRISDELMKTGKIKPWIFVGIDNGGSTTESTNPMWDRANEYLPYPDDDVNPPLPSPQGRLFPEFLENEVRPLVESNYRTLNDPDHVGLGGASYGAVIALFTAIEHPGTYGRLLLESPSLYIGNRALLHQASSLHNRPKRVYIGVGTKEGQGNAPHEMLADAQELVATLKKTTGTLTCFVVVPGAEHGEDAWRARLPNALTFLLGSGPCPD